MNPALPIYRILLVCLGGRLTNPGERVTLRDGGGAETELAPAGDSHVVLVNPVYALAPAPGDPYPVVLDLYLYAQLSNAHGAHGVAVELVRWEQGREQSVVLTQETRYDFGSDRATAHGYRARLRAEFAVAGQYTFRLLCDGVEIGRAEVEMVEAS